MDRITFLESISGIQYPEMLAEFFDQFIALKYLVEDCGKISVVSNTSNSITFIISFSDSQYRDKALSNVQTSAVNIYGKLISVGLKVLSDTEIEFVLQ